MNLRPALFALLPLLVAAGCAAPAEGVGDSTAAVVAETAPSSSQVFHASSDATRLAVVQEFRRQNGNEWNVDSFSLGGLYAVDGYRNFIRQITRRDPLGPTVTMTAADAKSKTVAFVSANARLLGLTASELAGLDVTVAPPLPGNPYYSDYLYFTVFKGALVQPGFEAFPSVASKISLHVGVHKDGEIRAVLQSNTVHQPELSLSTSPGLASDDPRVAANVVGTELADYKAIGASGFQTIYKKTALGAVSRQNIVATRLTIRVDDGSDLESRSFTLAYEVTARMVNDGQDYLFAFMVDAATGSVLYAPTEVPFGIIQ